MDVVPVVTSSFNKDNKRSAGDEKTALPGSEGKRDRTRVGSPEVALIMSETRETDSGTTDSGKSVIHNETSASSASDGMADQATGAGDLRHESAQMFQVSGEDVAPQAFEALRKSYFSLASEQRKLGGRLRKVRGERDSYKLLLKELTKADTGLGSKDDWKAMVARLTLDSQAITAERDKLKEMLRDRPSQSMGGRDMSSTMTESQVDRMVLSFAGDMAQSSAADEGLSAEFRKVLTERDVAVIKYETAQSELEMLRGKFQEEVQSKRATEEANRKQYIVDKDTYEDLIEAKQQKIMAEEQLATEIQRGLNLEKELEVLKMHTEKLRVKLETETAMVSTFMNQNAVGPCTSLPVARQQDMVMAGADAHLVMESQYLSDENKSLKLQLAEIKGDKEKAERELEDCLRVQKDTAEELRQRSQELDAIREKAKHTEKEVTSAEQKLKEREAELVALRHEKKSCEMVESRLMREVDVLKERLDAEHDITETTHRELVASQTEGIECRRKLQYADKQNADLRRELDEVIRMNGELNSRVQGGELKVKEEIERLRQSHLEEMAHLQAELHFMGTDLEKAQNETASLRQELSQVHYSQAMSPGERTSGRDKTEELELVLRDVFELQTQRDNMSLLLEQQRRIVKALYQQLASGQGWSGCLLDKVTQSAPAALALRVTEKERVPAAAKFPSALHKVPPMGSVRSASSGSLLSSTHDVGTSHKMPLSNQRRPLSDPDWARRVKAPSESRGRSTHAALTDLTPLGIPTSTVILPTTSTGTSRSRGHYENVAELEEMQGIFVSASSKVKSKQTGI